MGKRATDATGAVEGKWRRRRPWLIAVVAVAAVCVLALGASGLYLWNLAHTFDTQTTKIAKAFPSPSARPPTPTGPAAQAQNILLIGSDTRGNDHDSLANISAQRSDTIMVVHIPANRQHIYVMSIMRDSWVTIPGDGQAKINAALSWGGVPLAVQTIESLIGVPIDHVALMDFDAFKGMTNALGSVIVDVPIGFSSFFTPGETFAPGPQSMNGDQALDFVRERHAFPDGDYQRVRDQQLFIKAILDRVFSMDTLSNPVTVNNLINTVSPYLAVDPGFTASYAAGLALQLRDLKSTDVTFFTFPTAGTGTSADGQSIVNLDPAQDAVVKQAFMTDTLDQYTPVPQE